MRLLYPPFGEKQRADSRDLALPEKPALKILLAGVSCRRYAGSEQAGALDGRMTAATKGPMTVGVPAMKAVRSF
jgi:hypothetical protein